MANARAVFYLLRLNRTIMVALITGTGAYAAGAGVTRSLWMVLAGWCLAVGGFSLDFYADRDADSVPAWVGIRHNPLAGGQVSPRAGLAFSLAFIAASFVLTAWLSPPSLVPWAVIAAVIGALALHWFDTPLGRALTLGGLQGLYVLMGGAAGTLTPAVWLLAGLFFFAMVGGRGMIDVRDLAQDEAAGVATLPRRYGVQRTALFSAVCLLLSSALGVVVYATGELRPVYLYLDAAFVAVVMACAGLFAARPTPRLAYVLTLVCMMGAGTLICAAVVLGS